MLDAAPTDQDTLLEVNNIEVIYNHVILVLKGVSLKAARLPRARSSIAANGCRTSAPRTSSNAA